MPPSMHALARARLASLLEDDAMRRQSDRLRFWQAWKDKGGGAPVHSLSDFDAACATAAGALAPLVRLSVVVGSLAASGQPPHAMAPDARNLIRELAIGWAQEHVRRHGAGEQRSDDGCYRVAHSDPFAAQLAAAVQVDAGVRLAVGGSGDHFVSNVITETEALEMREGPTHPVIDVVASEVFELLETLSQGLEPARQARVDASRSAPVYTADSVAALVAVYADIVQQSLQVRPVLAINEAGQGPLATDPKARIAVHSVLGLEVVLIASAASGVPGAVGTRGALEVQLKETLMKIIRALEVPPKQAAASPPTSPPTTPPSVFISYAHVDGVKWLKKVQLQLSAGVVTPWSDTQLQTGDDWLASITSAMSTARCSVLIVTPGFLASRFITDQEVPKLLNRREAEGMTLLPILASDCDWQSKAYLKRFQMLGGGQPLDLLSRPKQNTKLADLARQIRALIETTT